MLKVSAEKQRQRADKLLQIIEYNKPHVVCLQEVTMSFLSHFLGDKFLRENFVASDVSASTFQGYGVVTLCNKDVGVQFKLRKLPSQMERRTVFTEIQIDENNRFTVCNVHLESLRSGEVRKAQLEAICKCMTLSVPASFCVVGDFNFDVKWKDCKKREETVLEKYSVKDAWQEIYPEGNEGYTMDNPNKSPCRIDRFCYRSDTQNFVVKEIQILGKKPNVKNDLLVSDHYGLLVDAKFSEN